MIRIALAAALFAAGLPATTFAQGKSTTAPGRPGATTPAPGQTPDPKAKAPGQLQQQGAGDAKTFAPGQKQKDQTK